MQRQIRCVRGSPLIRSILITLALAATAVGLARVTAARTSGREPVPVAAVEKSGSHREPAQFHLLLSAPAALVEIDTGTPLPLPIGSSSLTGTVELDPADPRVSLIVRWKNPAAAGEHRFAKLTLEAPGQATFSHVFDAQGDIDDFLELPLSPAK